MKRLADESGNVLLETALGLVLLGAIVLPAITTLTTITTARRQADEAAFTIARAWAASDTGERLTAARATAAALTADSGFPTQATVRCSDVCTDAGTSVIVTVVVQTGLWWPDAVLAVSELDKDAYEPY